MVTMPMGEDELARFNYLRKEARRAALEGWEFTELFRRLVVLEEGFGSRQEMIDRIIALERRNEDAEQRMPTTQAAGGLL